MDKNVEHLNLTHRFAEKYASEVKINLRFKKALDRREAIKDAGFVINTAMAEGIDTTRR